MLRLRQFEYIILSWSSKLLKLLAEFRKSKEIELFVVAASNRLNHLKSCDLFIEINPRRELPSVVDYNALKQL